MSKMERNKSDSLTKTLKEQQQHCTENTSSSTKDHSNYKHSHHFQNNLKHPFINNLNTQRSTLGSSDHHHHQLDLYSKAAGFASWPPRSYSCGFCKREFRSAQALGGHMNVHRRDRARLRLSSPPPPSQTIDLTLNPNPTQNPSPNPRNPNNINAPPVLPSSNIITASPSPSPSSVTDVKLAGFKLCRSSSLRHGSKSIEEFQARSTTSHRGTRDGSNKCQRNGSLNLEMSNFFRELKAEDVDLELRLGYS